MLKLEFFVDEFLFGIPQAFQKCMELIKHPNFRKKFVEPGVYGKLNRYILSDRLLWQKWA